MSNCLIFALLFGFLCGSSTGYQDDSGKDFIVAELIHRDSALSPFYNSSRTASERMREVVTRSLNTIITSNSSQHFNAKGVISPMISVETDYLMTIKADNSQEFLLMASTGRGFTWIDCQDRAGTPYFTPKQDGGSYEKIPRSLAECRGLEDIKPGPLLLAGTTPTCDYTYSYLGKVKTKGVLSRAKFQLDSTDTKGFMNSRRKNSILLFGCCTTRTESTFDRRIQGMAGLGNGDLSLISQLAKNGISKQFSYCLLPLGSKNPTKLVFGKGTKFKGEQDSKLPFKTKIGSPYYYVTLRYVHVQTFETQKLQEAGNMIIDFGTTVTSLHPIIFGQVRSFVKNSLPSSIQPVEEDESNPFKLCYYIGHTSQDMFPNIELHFKGFEGEKTSISLKYENIFVQYKNDKNDEMICMNIVPASGEFSVLGNVAQVGFHVEFNLMKSKIYFTPAVCTEFGIQST